MSKILGGVLFAIVRSIIDDLVISILKPIGLKFATWLDSNIHGRRTKLVVGVLLGVAAYFLLPIILSVFH